MSAALDLQEYCKICQQSFPTWDEFLVHKIQSNKHISCLFCGHDFKTADGCSRHQHQYHAAEQNLKCAGCGLAFIRVGSYISHIEQKQCPVIHKPLFEARRAEREKAIREEKLGDTVTTDAPTDTSSLYDGSLAFEDNGPTQTRWDDWGEDDTSTKLDEEKFPALPLQNSKDGASKVPDLLSGRPDKLNQENLAWVSQKELFPYLPDKPSSPPERLLAAMTVDPLTQQEEFHPWDPDSPNFDSRQYYNPITQKFRCPWPGCKKLQSYRGGLIQHLRSPAHMDAKLRCPGCLRQYSSATALVQHAESQAIKCQIRDSNEYKTAVDQITGGFVDTAGRHQDHTVRYIAPAALIEGNGNDRLQSQVANATAAYWAKQEEKHADSMKRMGKEGCW